MPVTDFPNQGDDKQVSLANSQWPLFPVGEASELQRDFSSIWDEGGNIRGNEQFKLLAPMARERRGPRNAAEERAVRLREAWVARHKGDFRLPGVVAQIKWLSIGSRGIDHMREVIRDAKDKLEDKKNFTAKLNTTYTETEDKKGIIKSSFIISTDTIDRQGEIVDQDGWDFSNYMKNPVVLDTHRYESIDDVVGKVVGQPRRKANGWVVDMEFADTPKGRLAQDLVANGFINTVSVGFRSVQRRPEGKLMRHIKMELLEISLVAVPANPEALRVKAVQTNRDLPLAPEDYEWNQPAALVRVREYASSDGSGDKDTIDWSKYARAFMLVREGLEEDFGGYGYPYADVIDGRLYAHIRPVQIIANILAGGQGGGKLSPDDRRKMARVVKAYYDKADLELPESVAELAKGYEEQPMDKPEEEQGMIGDKPKKPMGRKNVGLLMELRDALLEAVAKTEDIVAYYEGEDEEVEDSQKPYDYDDMEEEKVAPKGVQAPNTNTKLVEGIRGLLAAFDRRVN